MKTTMKSMLALMAGTMMFAACSNDDVTENINEQKTSELKPMTFTATMEAKDGTSRAFIDGLAIKWSKDDKISIFDGAAANNGNQAFTLNGDGGSSTGTFTGEAAEAEIYCALYPYTSGVTMNNGTLTGVVLPAEQTATAGTAAKDAILMYGASEDASTLQFMNFCAYVKVTPEFDCTSIILESNGEENLAGTLKVSMNGFGKPTTTVTANGTNTITLTGTITANNTYYIAVRPEKLASGFTIYFNTADGKYMKSTSNAVTFTRNDVTNLGSFKISDLTIPTTGKAYATINGSQVKVKWVQLWKGGPKFAEFNVGAANNKAEDYGGYYTWGGTYMNGKGITWTDDHNEGTVALTGDSDTATKLWGSNWRMPTNAEIQALINKMKPNCTWTFTTNYNNTGVKGVLFKGIEGTAYENNSLFLPAAGYCMSSGVTKQESYACYWSSQPCNETNAYNLLYFSNAVALHNSKSTAGYSVRAILVE